MRILSQDGKIDMPYELVALSVSYKISKAMVDKNVFCVNAHSHSLDAKRIIMGEYSSEDRAKKAMELLRGKYLEMTIYPFSDKSSMVKPKVFRFPEDDEIEVRHESYIGKG